MTPKLLPPLYYNPPSSFYTLASPSPAHITTPLPTTTTLPPRLNLVLPLASPASPPHVAFITATATIGGATIAVRESRIASQTSPERDSGSELVEHVRNQPGNGSGMNNKVLTPATDRHHNNLNATSSPSIRSILPTQYQHQHNPPPPRPNQSNPNRKSRWHHVFVSKLPSATLLYLLTLVMVLYMIWKLERGLSPPRLSVGRGSPL